MSSTPSYTIPGAPRNRAIVFAKARGPCRVHAIPLERRSSNRLRFPHEDIEKTKQHEPRRLPPEGGRQDREDEHPRKMRIRINRAIDELIRQLSDDGTPEFRAFAADTIVRLQGERALKDRKWFALMGFDSYILKNG